MREDDDRLLGSMIASQFRVIRRLGAGGMGAVYLAEQADMGRRVVIKVMHPELTAGNPHAVERFKREARAVAALNHPHIVQVYIFGQAADGRLYLAMELIEGRDLATELKRQPLTQGRALKVLDQIAAALIEAHSHGIVHRDLKPENVMLADRYGNPDWVKVLDFGIAKVGHAEGKEAQVLTQQGAIFGTPRYMAPEQITGGVIDARTDLYALGVIFYEMLTGEHPFRANSSLDYLMKHVDEAVVAPNDAYPGLAIHPRVEALLARLLAKKQADRFQSAAELQREIRVALGEAGESLSHTLSISADAVAGALRESEDAEPETHAPASRRRSRAWLWAILALIVVAGGIAVAAVALGKKTPSVALLSPDAAAPDVVTATDAGAADTRATAIDAGPSDVAGVQAGSPIEDFPVPAGTTLLESTPMALRLESTLAPRAIIDFYKRELAGRVKPMASGLEVTDATSPWRFVLVSRNGDRVSIQVNRRAGFEPSEDATSDVATHH